MLGLGNGQNVTISPTYKILEILPFLGFVTYTHQLLFSFIHYEPVTTKRPFSNFCSDFSGSVFQVVYAVSQASKEFCGQFSHHSKYMDVLLCILAGKVRTIHQQNKQRLLHVLRLFHMILIHSYLGFIK